MSALIQSIYSRLFASLVKMVNSKFSKDSSERNHITLFDSPGFCGEKPNSFDALCKNYRAEKIHHEFLRLNLTLEQEKYVNDGN